MLASVLSVDSDPTSCIPPVPSPRITAALVGAQKSGTTTLAALLGAHPSICLARNKEAHLFDQSEVQGRGPNVAEIDAWFPHRRPGQILLGATPSYLYLPGCLEALVRHAPDVRVLVVLRSPADRAVSHYGHERRLGTEHLPFVVAMASERRRLRRDPDPLAADSAHRHSSYLDRGRYAGQLERLRSLTANYHVVLFNDLMADPGRVLDGIVDFLGVERRLLDQIPRLNAGDGRRRRLGRAMARRLTRADTTEAEAWLNVPAGTLR